MAGRCLAPLPGIGSSAERGLHFVGANTSGAVTRKFLRDVSGATDVKAILIQTLRIQTTGLGSNSCEPSGLLETLTATGRPDVYVCWWMGRLVALPLVLRPQMTDEQGTVAGPLKELPPRSTSTNLDNGSAFGGRSHRQGRCDIDNLVHRLLTSLPNQ